jgi:hypothetical protein
MHEKTGFSKVTRRHSGVPAFRRSGVPAFFPRARDKTDFSGGF